MVLPPNNPEEREADGKRRRAAQGSQQFIERAGNLERDDEQGEREGQHRVAEAFQPQDFVMGSVGFAAHRRHVSSRL